MAIRLWQQLILLLAFIVWVAVVVWSAHEAVTFTPWIGLPGLTAAVGGVAMLRMARQSWASAFGCASVLGVVLMFGIFFSLVTVY